MNVRLFGGGIGGKIKIDRVWRNLKKAAAQSDGQTVTAAHLPSWET